MKKLITLDIVCIVCTLISITLFMNSCKKENIGNANQDTNIVQNRVESEKMIDFLVTNLLFKRESIQETADGFIAEGDIYFPKKDFWKIYGPSNETQTERHYQYSSLVTATSSVPVYIDSRVPTLWRKAVKAAISKWNGLSGGIRFTEVGSVPSHGITVTFESLTSSGYSTSTYAIGQYPGSSGYSGTYIKINRSFYTSVPSETMKSVMVHELGHTIGIRHTDSGDGSQIMTGITACDSYTDPSSIMQPSLSLTAGYIGFSDCDRAAFAVLYP